VLSAGLCIKILMSQIHPDLIYSERTKTVEIPVRVAVRNRGSSKGTGRINLKANKYFTCVQNKKVPIGHWKT